MYTMAVPLVCGWSLEVSFVVAWGVVALLIT